MREVQLDDMIEFYPEPSDPLFQQKIGAKREFIDYAAQASEMIPPRGEGFTHQTWISRILKATDRILLDHEVGSGKTCTYVQFCERVKNEYLNSEEETIKKKFLVILPNTTLEREFRNELICKCTKNDEYENVLVGTESSEISRRNAINSKIREYYDIRTRQTFANELKTLSDEQIIMKYSDTIIFLDEAHAFRNVSLSNEEMNPDIYSIYFRFFHLIQRSIIIFATATPMIDSANEFIPILNLLLPLFKQIPSNMKFEEMNLQTLEPYFRGIISYVRRLDNGVDAEYQGFEVGDVVLDEFGKNIYDSMGNIVEAKATIYPSQMSEFQSNVYRRILEDSKTKRDHIHLNEQYSSNFVFPDGSIGREGLAKYTTSVKGKLRPTPELSYHLTSLNRLSKLSIKFANIIDIIENTPGISFCYNEYIDAGAELLAMCLESFGYERFEETISVFASEDSKELKSYCSSTSRKMRSDFTKKKRYAVLSGDTRETDQSIILECLNSEENIHGEYILCFIVSRAGREGINTANCIAFHVVSFPWTPGALQQAFGRVFRATSHELLMKIARRKYIEEERKKGSSFIIASVENVRIKVKVYLHCSYMDDGSPTIDIQQALSINLKKREISKIVRIMKQCSVDCQTNRDRNVRDGDIDGSEECDFDVCDYDCVNEELEEIDTSTYDVYYIQEMIDKCRDAITTYFSEKFSVSGDVLYKWMNMINEDFIPKYVDFAVEQLVTNKIPIRDRFGHNCYLRSDGHILFLQRDFPIVTEYMKQDHYELTVYTENLNVYQPLELTDYLSIIKRDISDISLESLFELNPKDAYFYKYVNELSLDKRIWLLENSIINSVEGNSNEHSEGILTYYSNFVHVTHEPYEEIVDLSQRIIEKETGRGRRPNPNTKFRPKKLNLAMIEEKRIEPNENNEVVYLHTLYLDTDSVDSYAINSKFFKGDTPVLRMYKPSEQVGWRECKDIEKIVYYQLVQQNTADRMKVYEDYKIYGMMLTDGKFKIVDQTVYEEKESVVDARRRGRGRECETRLLPYFYTLMWELGIDPPEVKTSGLSKKELIDAHFPVFREVSRRELEKQNRKKLEFTYSWIQSNYQRIEICRVLLDYFIREKRLFTIYNFDGIEKNERNIRLEEFFRKK